MNTSHLRCSPLGLRPYPPGKYRIASAIVVGSMLLSCSLLTPGGLATEIGSPEQATRATLAQAEEDVWAALRAPLREQLGAEADSTFKQLDEVRRALLTQALQDMNISGEGFKAPGLAQFEALSSVIAALAAIPGGYASREDGSATSAKPFGEGSAKGEEKLTITKSASHITAEIELRVTLTAANGAVMTETAKGKMEIQLCPDAEGGAPVSISMTMNSEVSGGEKGVSIQFTLDGSTDALVNDNADLTGYTLDITSGFSSQTKSGGKTTGQFAEVHTGITFGNLEVEGGSKVSGYDSQVTRTSSQADGSTAEAARKLGQTMAMFFMTLVSREAEEIWQNGYCVEIVVEGAEDHNIVPPASTTPFTARVRHKFEGTDLNVPVQAALSGEEAIAPMDRTNAPVSYVYTAPEEMENLATASLETRSNRGAAKKDISFYLGARPYQAYASALGTHFTQYNICNLKESFTISGSNPGFSSFEANFTPLGGLVTELHGEVTFTQTTTYSDEDFRGTYVVVFYDHGEGDIVMKGTLRMRIKNPPGEIVTQTEFRIAIRQATDMVCPDN